MKGGGSGGFRRALTGRENVRTLTESDASVRKASKVGAPSPGRPLSSEAQLQVLPNEGDRRATGGEMGRSSSSSVQVSVKN